MKIKGEELNIGDLCSKGSQLRPHIVWFGVLVPMMDLACAISTEAAIFIVVGTSLNVYPAANLINYASLDCPIYLIDPNMVSAGMHQEVKHIKEKAGTGVPALVKKLLKKITE